MSLINYKEIDFNKSINTTNKIINFNDCQIEIVNYLSTKDKYDLIMTTLNKSFENNIYNNFKMDLMFELNVIYSYTNIIFDEQDRFDEADLYDTLKRSGLVDMVLAEIPSDELQYLKSCIDTLSKTIIQYRNTFGSVFSAFVEELPSNIDKAKGVMESIDLEKVQQLTGIMKELAPSLG